MFSILYNKWILIYREYSHFQVFNVVCCINVLTWERIYCLQLTLETFGEGRTTKNKSVPYKGGMVDGPENGMPPPPWAIPCEPNEMFNTHTIKIDVPHTSVVKVFKHTLFKMLWKPWRDFLLQYF